MLGFALRRFGTALVLIWVVLTLTFFLIRLAPGDPLQVFFDPSLPRHAQERLRELYGLERPLPEQYARWLGAVVQGDWGTSIVHQREAARLLLERLPNSLLLVAAALLVEYGAGVLMGALAAARADEFLDRQLRIFSLFLFALPSFWLALVLIEFFAVRWPIFPSGQMSSLDAATMPPAERLADLLRHLVLPALALGLVRSGAVARFVRNGLLDVLEQDYIRTARALGVRPWRVLGIHALKNALAPLVQRFGLSLPALISGALVIEVIFSWPGMGQVTYAAILQRDYPVILAATALTGVVAVGGSLVADLLHAAIDPRVRLH